jgi:hypothetical protein
MRNRFLLVTFLVVVVLGSVGEALADELFIGSPTCPAPPGCPVFGTDVNGLTGNTITIHQTGGQTTLSPVLLIIGVPNQGSSFAGPAISSVSPAGSGSLGGAAVYSGSWNSTTGFAGSFTSAFSGAPPGVYNFIGLVGPDGGSENFGNWSAAESAVLGITSTSFGIFVYQLSGTGLTGGGSVSATFASGLPVGTFIVAYGCSQLNDSSCKKEFGTPFTQAGLVVPEPATLGLFGTGLLALAGMLRRRMTG